MVNDGWWLIIWLVVDLPLWKMMEWVRQLGWCFIPNCFWKVRIHSMVPVTTNQLWLKNVNTAMFRAVKGCSKAAHWKIVQWNPGLVRTPPIFRVKNLTISSIELPILLMSSVFFHWPRDSLPLNLTWPWTWPSCHHAIASLFTTSKFRALCRSGHRPWPSAPFLSPRAHAPGSEAWIRKFSWLFLEFSVTLTCL